MMAMTISPRRPRSIYLGKLSWQIKHVRARLGRLPENRIVALQTVEFTLGQARIGDACQGLVACPIEAALPQAAAPKIPGRDEEHPMKKSILSTLVVVTSLAAASSASAQDAAAGKTSFNKCLACHAIGEGAKNKVGPQLNGLDGRKSGTAPDFSYTDANKNSGITWNEAQFKEYIKDPKAKIPGTKMAFAGIKNDKEVNDLWAFLSQYDKDGKTKKCPPPAAPYSHTSRPRRAHALVGGGRRALRNLADHGVDLGDHEVGHSVLDHVTDTRQHDQFCVRHGARER